MSPILRLKWWFEVLKASVDLLLPAGEKVKFIREKKNLFYHRGTYHLYLGNFKKAGRDFARAEELENKEWEKLPEKSTSDCYLQMIFICHWLAGRKDEAVVALEKIANMKISHSDIGGGVISPSLLWFVSSFKEYKHLRPLAEKKLQKIADRKTFKVFPAQIADYLLGKMTRAEMANEEERFKGSPTPSEGFLAHKKDPRDWCQFWFYVGAKELSEEKAADAEDAFRKAIQFGEECFGKYVVQSEYFLAKDMVGNHPAGHS